MESVKIMPCLDMKNGRVVKGIHFTDLRDAGDPAGNASFYEQEGADELAMLDIAATVENRKTRVEWVRNVSSVINIPLTVGGGISELSDIDMLLEAGANVRTEDDFALRRAARMGHADVVQLLLEAGADVRAKDDLALRWAAEYGHADVVKILESWIAEHG